MRAEVSSIIPIEPVNVPSSSATKRTAETENKTRMYARWNVKTQTVFQAVLPRSVQCRYPNTTRNILYIKKGKTAWHKHYVYDIDVINAFALKFFEIGHVAGNMEIASFGECAWHPILQYRPKVEKNNFSLSWNWYTYDDISAFEVQTCSVSRPRRNCQAKHV